MGCRGPERSLLKQRREEARGSEPSQGDGADLKDVEEAQLNVLIREDGGSGMGRARGRGAEISDLGPWGAGGRMWTVRIAGLGVGGPQASSLN